MTVLSLLAAAALMQPAPVKTYVSKPHGLMLEVPKTWKITEKKNFTEFTFSTKSGIATVSVFAIGYRRPSEEWQELQRTVVEQSGYTLSRQWEETLLGVPLLLTLSSKDSKSREVGIIYNASNSKFNYRLDVDTSAYNEATEAWKSVLVSIHTNNGQLPTPEDGISAPDRIETKPSDKPTVLTNGSKPTSGRYESGTVKVSPAKREMNFRFNPAWEYSAKDDISGTFTKKGTDITFSIDFYSQIDSPEAAPALRALAASDLDKFTAVTSRVNAEPKVNGAGARVESLIRIGQGSGGPRQSLIAMGSRDGFYWTTMVESADAKQFELIKNQVLDFYKTAGFEIPK